MRTFKSKLRQIGNSQGVYIPKNVITGYHLGDTIVLKVITSSPDKDSVITKEDDKPEKPVITSDKVITSKSDKKLVFNVKKGINEWIKR